MHFYTERKLCWSVTGIFYATVHVRKIIKIRYLDAPEYFTIEYLHLVYLI